MIYDLRFTISTTPERGLQPASMHKLQATLKRHECRAPQTRISPIFRFGDSLCSLLKSSIVNRQS